MGHLHLADYIPERITKAEKDFAKKLDFKHIKFWSNLETRTKLKKNNSIAISVFLYENK